MWITYSSAIAVTVALQEGLTLLQKTDFGGRIDNWTLEEAEASYVQEPNLESGVTWAKASPRQLATLRVLGDVPGAPQLKVLTAVPVSRSKGLATQQLWITVGCKYRGCGKRFGIAGNHTIQFRSGKVASVAKYVDDIEPWRSLNTVSNWYADVPDAEWRDWTTGDAEACLEFTILKGSDSTRIKTCHRPQVLPAAEKPYDFVMCFSGLIANDTTHGGLYSGRRKLLPSIAYHNRHGVDQFVVYVDPPNGDVVSELLAKPIELGLVTIILMDLIDANQIDTDWIEQHGERRNVQDWLINDCLNRFKSHTELLRTIDYDEFMYNPTWRESGTLEGRSLFDDMIDFRESSADYLKTTFYDWELTWDFLETTRREERKARKCPKSILKPDRVALTYVHTPTNCFGRCDPDESTATEMEFAHYRLLRDNETGDLLGRDGEAVNSVTDTLFVDEAKAIDGIVGDWFPSSASVSNAGASLLWKPEKPWHRARVDPVKFFETNEHRPATFRINLD